MRHGVEPVDDRSTNANVCARLSDREKGDLESATRRGDLLFRAPLYYYRLLVAPRIDRTNQYLVSERVSLRRVDSA